MSKYFVIALAFVAFISCNQTQKSGVSTTVPDDYRIEFSIEKANYLYHFAYECIDREYPNKPGHVMGDSTYLATPYQLHPAFYGCFDWHSAVHGHWTLVTILSKIPDFEKQEDILTKLETNITDANIKKEIEYFYDEHNKTFERTYGWAWLLKLDEALLDWNTPKSKQLHNSLKPLVDLLAERYIGFLDKLIYPIRVGEHPNTAFGMSFAYDFAKKYHSALALKIEEKAREYYLNDTDAPIKWEPGGFDFLSPCLQEASLMQKVLPVHEFRKWLNCFLPGFENDPASFLQPAIVTDRSDGKMAHLDGLNFSRAWCLYEIGYGLKNEKMLSLARQHFDFSYTKMDTGEYAGAHWLASFACYAILKSEN